MGFTLSQPSRESTLVVASSNSLNKNQADYICDGVDDSVAINAAIAALPTTTNASGGRVVLLDGDYKLQTPITNDRDYTTIEGQSVGGVQIMPQTTYSPTALLVMGNTRMTTRCEVKNIRFYGGRNATPARTVGHGVVWHSKNGSIKHIWIQECPQDGLRLEGYSTADCWENYVEDVYCSNPGNDGIVTAGGATAATNNEFVRCMINGAKNQGTPYGRYGINNGGSQNKFVVCHPYFNLSHGMFSTANGLQIVGGEYETNGGSGIFAYGATIATIIGPTCYDNALDPIVIGTTGQTASGYTIVSPKIYKGGSNVAPVNGILIDTAGGVQVLGGTIRDCTNAGIQVKNSSRNVFQGVRINAMAGGAIAGSIVLNTGASFNAVRDCIVENGIAELDTADNNLIVDNQLMSSSVITRIGTSTGVRGNKGYFTERSGTGATITAGQTSIAVTHGLGTTPSRVLLTATNDTGTRFWVSAKGSTTFTISITAAQGGNVTFDWRASVYNDGL